MNLSSIQLAIVSIESLLATPMAPYVESSDPDSTHEAYIFPELLSNSLQSPSKIKVDIARESEIHCECYFENLSYSIYQIGSPHVLGEK